MGKLPSLDDLFVDDPLEVDTPIDDCVYINVEEIDQKAKDESMLMVKDLEKVYGNEEFMRTHPDYKKRLDIELEALRLLIKMRKADEVTHDILVKQIGMTPNNASMYSALNKMQASIISIQTKMDSTIKTINGLLKNYQLELPFSEEEVLNNENIPESSSGEDFKVKNTYRGSKAFIENINKSIEKDDNLPNQLNLFEDEDNI